MVFRRITTSCCLVYLLIFFAFERIRVRVIVAAINLNKVVATFEKHIFLSQTDLTRTGIISNSYNEMFEA
jgi:hypothetical protein